MNKIKHIRNITITISLAALLAGCSSDSKKVVDLNLLYATTSSVPVRTNDIQQQNQIVATASTINKSLSELSAMQQATHPSVALDPTITASTTGMTSITSINYNGDLETVLQTIANKGGYKVKTVGNKPSIPVLVNLTERNQVLANILQNLAYQAAKQATITVDPSQKTINLAYHAY